MLPDGLHPEADRDFWIGAQPAQLGGAECSVSSREDTIVHAVAHAARPETDPSLRWAADVAALVQSAPTRGIDWDRVTSQARRHRLALQTAQALEVVRRVADVAVPVEVIGSLSRSRVPLAERVDARPCRRRDGRSRLPSWAEHIADAYQRFIGRQVPPARRATLTDRGRFLQEWWDLERLRDVLPYSAFVAAGRPWKLAERSRGLPLMFRPSPWVRRWDSQWARAAVRISARTGHFRGARHLDDGSRGGHPPAGRGWRDLFHTARSRLQACAATQPDASASPG